MRPYEFKLYFCGNWPPPYSYVENIPDPKLNEREIFFWTKPEPWCLLGGDYETRETGSERSIACSPNSTYLEK